MIRGAKVGRSTVEVSAGSQRGEIYVAVAPPVDLAGVTNGGLAAVRADGTNFRLIVARPPFPPTPSTWPGTGGDLFVIDTGTSRARAQRAVAS